MQIAGCVAIVTGGSEGIGRTVAARLLERGAKVCLAAPRQALLDEAIHGFARWSRSVMECVTDATKPLEVERLFNQVEERWGRVAILVNAAGVFRAIGPLWDVQADAWWRDVEVSVRGTQLCCREMLRRTSIQSEGIVINFGGGGAGGPFTYGSGYGAGKAAILRLTETLALELREQGWKVRVYALNPGAVHTAMAEFQLTSAAGQRYLPRAARVFAEGRDVAPSLAANLVAWLIERADGQLSGRFFDVTDDLGAVEQHASDIVATDSKVLRVVPWSPP